MNPTSFVLFVAIAIALIFFMGRTQRRMAKQHNEMVARLKAGDEVVTLGGIYGTITEIEEGDTVLLEISEDTDIRLARASIGRVITPAEEPVHPDHAPSDTPAE